MSISALIMVKNEESSIKVTLLSLKNIISNIIILDTGSTDNTIPIIKQTCIENHYNLFLKETLFKTFPESRNEAIEFAETVVNTTFLLLLDAGDELKLNGNLNYFNLIPSKYKYGLIKHHWVVNNNNEVHYDCRFIRNLSNCRYNLLYPVHETFIDVKQEEVVNVSHVITLFQNRDKYGLSTEKRYKKDIELLLNSRLTKRNLYYLSQTYINQHDYYNGFKYSLLCHETPETKDEEFNEHTKQLILIRISVCAINCDMDEGIIIKYITKAMPFIDAYIIYMQYCISKREPEKALPYINKLMILKKPDESSISSINHEFYDYTRWNLISIICLQSKKELKIGKYACELAIKNKHHQDDINILNIYNNFLL